MITPNQPTYEELGYDRSGLKTLVQNVPISANVIDAFYDTSQLQKIIISSQDWQYDGAFSASDNDTVAWTAGTLTLADKKSYAIGAGNTGNITAFTYIYFDKDVSETALQTTTNPIQAVGANKILVAIANNVADTNKLAEYQVYGGMGGVNKLLTAASIVTNSLVVGTNVGLGTAQTAGQVTTIIDGRITTGYINALAITVLGAVTAGSLTGLTYQTSASGMRVKIDSDAGYGRVNFRNGDTLIGIVYGDTGNDTTLWSQSGRVAIRANTAGARVYYFTTAFRLNSSPAVLLIFSACVWERSFSSAFTVFPARFSKYQFLIW